MYDVSSIAHSLASRRLSAVAMGVSLLAKVAAIKTSLHLPPELELLSTLGKASELMGVVHEPGTTLPQMADALIDAIGCTVPEAAPAAAQPPPPPPLVGRSVLYNWPVVLVGWLADPSRTLLVDMLFDTVAHLPHLTVILLLSPYVGRCEGKIMKRNQDGHFYKKMDDERVKVILFIFYDIDGDEIKTALRLNEYGGDEEGSWVLLEAIEG